MKKFFIFFQLSQVFTFNSYLFIAARFCRAAFLPGLNLHCHWPIIKPSMEERDEEVRQLLQVSLYLLFTISIFSRRFCAVVLFCRVCNTLVTGRLSNPALRKEMKKFVSFFKLPLYSLFRVYTLTQRQDATSVLCRVWQYLPSLANRQTQHEGKR